MTNSRVEPSARDREDSAERARVRAEELRDLARRERRVIYAMFGVLATVTLVFGGANYYGIIQSRSVESPLSVEIRAALDSAVTLKAALEWFSTPEGAAGLPVVLLGGEPVPTALPVVAGGEQEPVRLGLSVIVPKDVKPGAYEGRLSFVVDGTGSEGESNEWTFPLSLEVPGVWEEWSLLLGWSFVLAAVLAAVYCALAYWFPAPRGTLTVRIAVGGADPRARVPLKLQSGLSGWLRPWTRSTVPLERTLRQDPGTAASAHLCEGLTLEFSRFGFDLIVVHFLNETDGPVYIRRDGLLSPHTDREKMVPIAGSRMLGTGDQSLELIVPETTHAPTLGGYVALSYQSDTEGT